MIFLLSIFSIKTLKAQSVRIEIVPPSIALNEPLTIIVESDDKAIINHSPFPEISGMKRIKMGISQHESETTFQGKKRKVYLLAQIYHPIRVGVVNIPAFEMNINNQKVTSVGANIRVKPFDKSKGELREPKSEGNENAPRIIEVREDAFLAVDVGKRSIYVGEGVSISLALYVATTNKATMQFIDINKQVEEIVKKLKPAHCWEENFHLKEVPEPPTIEINGKSYFQHKFYEAVIFPLNEQSIDLPAVDLNMRVRRKINSQDKTNEIKEGEGEVVTFRSEPKVIYVKSLPPHPLREQIAVGKFFLEENAPYRPLETGEGVNYYFKVVGEGNIAELHEPHAYNTNSQLVIYSPNRQPYIFHKDGRVNGYVIFEYLLMPQEAGKYALRNHLEWIFFNLATERYDTLRPQAQIQVSGKSYKGVGGQELKTHPLYGKMNQKIDILSLQDKQKALFWLNLTIGIMILFAFLTLIKRRKKQ